MTDKNRLIFLKEIHWLASFPKSGNTWLRMLYHSYVHDAPPVLDRADRTTYFDALPHLYQSICPFEVPTLPDEYVQLLRPAALINLIAERPAPPLVIKTHTGNYRVNSISLIPAELTASAVYMVRHPFDVARSYAAYLGVDTARAVELMCDTSHRLASNTYRRTPHYMESTDTVVQRKIPQIVASWALHVQQWLNFPDVKVIKYEEMLEAPAYYFTQALTLWGEEVDAERVNRAVERCKKTTLAERELKEGFHENNSPKDKFFSGKRPPLPRQQKNKLLEHCGEMMTQLGYEDK